MMGSFSVFRTDFHSADGKSAVRFMPAGIFCVNGALQLKQPAAHE